ncbi:MAG: hypothetical protein WC797_04145 [Candidatus Paceibacterota bacterium]
MGELLTVLALLAAFYFFSTTKKKDSKYLTHSASLGEIRKARIAIRRQALSKSTITRGIDPDITEENLSGKEPSDICKCGIRGTSKLVASYPDKSGRYYSVPVCRNCHDSAYKSLSDRLRKDRIAASKNH